MDTAPISKLTPIAPKTIDALLEWLRIRPYLHQPNGEPLPLRDRVGFSILLFAKEYSGAGPQRGREGREHFMAIGGQVLQAYLEIMPGLLLKTGFALLPLSLEGAAHAWNAWAKVNALRLAPEMLQEWLDWKREDEGRRQPDQLEKPENVDAEEKDIADQIEVVKLLTVLPALLEWCRERGTAYLVAYDHLIGVQSYEVLAKERNVSVKAIRNAEKHVLAEARRRIAG